MPSTTELTFPVSGSLADKIRAVHNLQPSDVPVSEDDASVPPTNGATAPRSGSPQHNGNGHVKEGNSLADLLAKGKLPSLPRKTAGNRWNDESPRASPAPLGVNGPGLGEPTSTARIELPAIDKQQAAKAIAEIKKLGVSVEMSKGSTNVTTVLLKGPTSAVDRARQIVERQLAPRITVRFGIPASTRSAVIGTRGSNLKNIISTTGTKINIDNTPRPRVGWALPLVGVEIVGSAKAAAEAKKMIIDSINNSTVQDVRELPESLRLFANKFTADKGYPGAADSDANVLRLSAKFSELQAAQEEIDNYIAGCVATYASKELEQLAGPSVPADVLFDSHNVVIADNSIYGPADKLEAAAEALTAYLAAIEQLQLNISKAHSRNAEHAARLVEYLELRGAIEELQNAYNVSISRPSNGLVYNISGRDKDSLQDVKRKLVQMVNQQVPASLVCYDGIESEFGQTQAKRSAESLRSRKHPAVAYVGSDGRVYVAYDFEASEDADFGPTNEEIIEALATAAEPFGTIASREANMVKKQVPMSKSDYKHIQSPSGAAKKRLSSLVEQGGIRKVGVSLAPSGDAVVVTGAPEDVEALLKELPSIVEESKNEFELLNFTKQIEFDPSFIKNLVGRNGAKISKIRETYNCKIEASSDGTVIVRGRENNVLDAVKYIKSLEKELKDYKVEELTVPRKYHAILIGSKGRFVRRMQDKYNVHVKFPARYDTPLSGSDDGSVSNESQSTDTIVLSGPSKGVAATKKEFEELLAYEKSHSYVQEVDIPSEHIPHIIGRHGAFISELCASGDLTIDVKRTDEKSLLVIRGAEKSVKAAIAQINAEIARLKDTVHKTVTVEQKYHRYLTGQGNSIRNQIVVDAGGDLDAAARILYIPSSSSGSNQVRISGPSKVVEAIEAKINEIVEDRKNRKKFKGTVNVPTNQLRFVIGPGGSTKRSIENELGVVVDIPNTKAPQTTISVSGRSEKDIEAAKQQILSLVDLGQIEMLIPAYLENDVFNRGALAQQLESKYGVKLSTPKRPGNPRAAPKPPSEEVENARATEPGTVYFKATPFENEPSDKTVKWVLLGKDEEACEEAKKEVQKLVDTHTKHDTTGYLWLPSSSSYSKIIGPGGSLINDVRSKSGCQIVVPKQGRSASEPVSIRGSKEDVERARQLLLSLAELDLD